MLSKSWDEPIFPQTPEFFLETFSDLILIGEALTPLLHTDVWND